MSDGDSATRNTALWFTKEQIEAEENAGRFNSPWDERSFRSRILQDWLTMYTLLAAAHARIAELEEAQQWYDVDELDLGGTMSSGQLLMDLGGVVAQGMYSAISNCWFYASGERVMRTVLRWRPLPMPLGGEAFEELSRAYRETTTAGPLDHRIRLIKRDLAAAQGRIAELEEALSGYDPTQRLPEPGQGVLVHLGTPRRTGLVILKYVPAVDDRYCWVSKWTGCYYRTDEVTRWWPLPMPLGGEA